MIHDFVVRMLSVPELLRKCVVDCIGGELCLWGRWQGYWEMGSYWDRFLTGLLAVSRTGDFVSTSTRESSAA